MRNLDEVFSNFEQGLAELNHSREQEKQAKDTKRANFVSALNSLQETISKMVTGRTAGGFGFSIDLTPAWAINLNSLAMKINAHDIGEGIARVIVESSGGRQSVPFSGNKSVFIRFDTGGWSFQEGEYLGPLSTEDLATTLVEHLLKCYIEFQRERPLS